MAAGPRCWIIEDDALRPCEAGELAGYASCVSLHTHSCHSTENIASLNWVVKLRYMRPLAGILQRAFGLARGEALDYREVTYNPPLRPADVWRMEHDKARRLGFEALVLGVTDHDEVAGSLELLQAHPELAARLPVGEELSLGYQGHVFHLGITGLPPATALEEHAELQACARRGDTAALFDRLRRLGCLVVLNHPLLPWTSDPEPLVLDLLERHGRAIDALEFNGMRTFEENRRVLALARRLGKPVIAGGDSHLLLASAAVCASRAETFAGFVDEVRAGRTVSVVTDDFLAPLGWKLTLRVLCFISQYRRIARFRGEPVARLLAGRWVLLDPAALAARGVLKGAGWLGRLS